MLPQATNKSRGNLELDLQRESKMAALLADKTRIHQNILRLTKDDGQRQDKVTRQPRERTSLQGKLIDLRFSLVVLVRCNLDHIVPSGLNELAYLPLQFS